MEELKEYVLNKYLKKFIHNTNGVKYIKEEDFNKLTFSDNEKKFIMDLLEKEKIEIKSEIIKKEDRPDLVRDYNYGDIISNNLQSLDKPEKATIEYDKEKNIKFENYEELEKYLEEVFIPKFIQMKIKKDPVTKEEIYEPSIQLNHIVKLKLSELEVKRVFKYLENLNIMVAGISPDFDLDSDINNYNYVRTFKSSPLPKYDFTINDEKRIFEYQKTKDLTLRNEIVENNMRLARFIAYKYSMITGIDIHELESYAYEGLIVAIDNFKNLGYKFSTYAYPCIRGQVLRGIEKIEGYHRNDFYYDYIACRKIVENINGTTVEYEPSLLKDIYELMTQTSRMSGCSFDDFKNLIYITKPIFLENMDDIESSYEIENDVFRNIEKEDIKEVLDTLTEREQLVIINIFGLFGNKPKSLEKVGEMFGVTRERIRQIEAKAIRKLRHPMRSRKLM